MAFSMYVDWTPQSYYFEILLLICTINLIFNMDVGMATPRSMYYLRCKQEESMWGVIKYYFSMAIVGVRKNNRGLATPRHEYLPMVLDNPPTHTQKGGTTLGMSVKSIWGGLIWVVRKNSRGT